MNMVSLKLLNYVLLFNRLNILVLSKINLNAAVNSELRKTFGCEKIRVTRQFFCRWWHGYIRRLQQPAYRCHHCSFQTSLHCAELNILLINKLAYLRKSVDLVSQILYDCWHHLETTTYGKCDCRAGLSIVPVVPWQGPPAARGPRSTAKFLPRCFDAVSYTHLTLPTNREV